MNNDPLKPADKLQDWIDKNGLPETIYMHPDTLMDLKDVAKKNADLLEILLKIIVTSKILNKGEFVLSKMPPTSMIDSLWDNPSEKDEWSLSSEWSKFRSWSHLPRF